MHRQRRRECEALAEQRSALVDGALNDTDRERVLKHLVSCPSCRADVAELRRLRRLLSAGAESGRTAAPQDLSERLVRIAGGQPQAARRRGRSSGVPVRHGHRGRAVASAVSAATVGLAVVAVGLAAAPPGVGSVPDPTGPAQAEFSAVNSMLPLGNESLGAVLMASARAPGQVAGGAVAPLAVKTRSGVAGTSALSAAGALSVLRRAVASADLISYSGTQSFGATVDDQTFSARMEVENHAGQGREVAVFDDQGHRLWASFTASGPTSRVVDSGQLSLLANNYLLTAFRGGSVAGRSATVVQAAAPISLTGGGSGLGPGPVAARWWVDDVSGLLLWYEAYDDAGNPTLSAGFTRVSVGHSPFLEHLPPRLAVPITTSSRILSSAPQLAAAGWACPDEIGGLSLVRIRTDAAASPTVLHLAYSDGLSTVSVFEQRGALAKPPAGSHWDPAVRAYVTSAAPSVASWQSDSTVFTVVTDGSADALARAVHALPHDAARRATTIERVQAGWARILSSVMG